MARRADVVPRLSYASVEDAFLELVHSSPVRNAAQTFTRMVNEKLEGLKVRSTQWISGGISAFVLLMGCALLLFLVSKTSRALEAADSMVRS